MGEKFVNFQCKTNQKRNMNCKYLEENLGEEFVDCLNQLALKQPDDPFTFLIESLNEIIAKNKTELDIQNDSTQQKEEFLSPAEREISPTFPDQISKHPLEHDNSHRESRNLPNTSLPTVPEEN